jgi:hypothetical protein
MGKYLGALVTVVLGAALVIGVIAAAGDLAKTQPTLAAGDAGLYTTIGGTRLKTVSLTLQTFPASPYTDPSWLNSHFPDGMDNGFPIPPAGDNQGWVTYWPSTTLKVPTNALVTLTIENYDGKTTLLNDFYARPQGVVHGIMTVDGTAKSEIDGADASHTFTIHSIPNSTQPWLFVSVPVTGVADDAPADDAGFPDRPVTTEFSFITPDKPGHYIWQCFDPCGSGFNGFGGPMSTKGYMSGTFDVVG